MQLRNGNLIKYHKGCNRCNYDQYIIYQGPPLTVITSLNELIYPIGTCNKGYNKVFLSTVPPQNTISFTWESLFNSELERK